MADTPGPRPAGAPGVVGSSLGRIDKLARRIPAPQHRLVLAALIWAGWAVLLEVARIASHNGWFYYHGGDATWYYTSAWVLAHGHIPQGYISYGYSLLLAPVAYVAGPNILVGTPAIVALNVLVLGPIALLCVFGITRMIGGRRFAYIATLAWIVFPVAVIHYFLPSYHSQYVDETLPPALGLTARGDFPSLVLLLVATYFAFRVIARPTDLDGIACGLAIGFAIAVKPSNALFLPAPIVAFALARRPRTLAVAAVGIVPSLIGLAFWKEHGLGHQPVLSPGALASPVGMLADFSLFGLHIGRYVPVSWSHLSHNLDGFREWTRSLWLIVLVALGGLLGLARRSIAMAAFVGLWLASFLVIKGSSPVVNFDEGTFLTHMIPAFPAFFLLLVSTPFLVPRIGRRLLGSAEEPKPGVTWPSRIAAGVLALASVIAALVVVVLPPLTAPAAVDELNQNLYLPLDRFPLSVKVSGDTVRLSWPSQRPAGSRVSYAVFRDPPGAVVCTPVPHAASACTYPGTNQVGSVPETRSSWLDHPPPGRWEYRVALSASPSPQQHSWNYIVLSRPVEVVRSGSRTVTTASVRA
jgi:hypothetical protein